MDVMAWFGTYMMEHVPANTWSAEADCAVRAAIRLWEATGEEACATYAVAWADCLMAADACVPACSRALFFALAKTGEEKYRDAIQQVMADLGRNPGAEPLDVHALCAELPFRMAYEMKLGGMEKVGLCAGKFRESCAALREEATGLVSGNVPDSVRVLLALADAIGVCSDQLYEHWRAMVDIFRSLLRSVLTANTSVQGETAAMLATAMCEGVRMNLIDPERYLPLADAYLAASGLTQAAAVLNMEGGAL